MMMASAKLVRDCSSELSSDVRSLSVASSTEEQDSTATESEYSEEEKEYELEDLQILKTIGTGTFGRVCLCRDKAADEYLAMKILSMSDVIRLKQVDHVMNEKSILAEINHPFIVNLRWWTHDDSCIYMLFDYVCGGELFSYLRNAGRFSNSIGNFYAAEIVSALEYLHARNIVYRDLKPENLLLAKDGHLKITDFGFAKKLTDRTWTLCGTPEYLAPEIIQSKGHNKAVDWWALGVLIYEMLVGYPPFYDDNPFGIYEKILNGRVDWPRHLDQVAKDIIKKLLVQDRTKRLGNMKCGSEDVKRHRWFKHIDWADVYMKKLQPPIVPSVSYEGDTSNFDEYPETDWKACGSEDVKRHRWFKHIDWADVYMKKLQPPIVPSVSYEGDTSNFDEYPETDWKACGSEDVKRHRWFKHIDWADVYMKKLQPSIVPSVSYEGDTSNFDEYPETDWKAVRSLDSDELKLFANF